MCLEGVLGELGGEEADRYDQNTLYTSTKFLGRKNLKSKHET